MKTRLQVGGQTVEVEGTFQEIQDMLAAMASQPSRKPQGELPLPPTPVLTQAQPAPTQDAILKAPPGKRQFGRTGRDLWERANRMKSGTFTDSESIVLKGLAQHQPMTSEALAEILDIPPGTVSSVLADSKKAGITDAFKDRSSGDSKVRHFIRKGQRVPK